MVAELYQPTFTATTDSTGAFTLTIPGGQAIGAGLAMQVAISVLNGLGGTFTADTSGIPWGQWSGPAPFGPLTFSGNLTLKIVGSGLNPNANYLVQLTGVIDVLENLDPAIPTVIGGAAPFGASAFLDVGPITLGEQQSQVYEWFPCSAWGSMRIGARNPGVSGAAPITIDAEWRNGALTRIMGTREWVVGPEGDLAGYKLEQVLPHLGDMLRITLANNTITA